MEQTVYVHMTRARLRRKIESIPSRAKETESIFRKIGAIVFRRIHKAFIAKSYGGTDEAGIRWAPLSRITILKRLRKRNKTSDKDRPSSALSPANRDKWWGFYRQALARFHEKHIAARIAWAKLKRIGGSGQFDKYGASSINILRDTEQLSTSLSPDSASPHKIFRVRRGYAELGTSRRGALAHHLGKGVPRRRLWPPPSHWPSAWWQEILVEARSGVLQLILDELKTP